MINQLPLKPKLVGPVQNHLHLFISIRANFIPILEQLSSKTELGFSNNKDSINLEFIPMSTNKSLPE